MTEQKKRVLKEMAIEYISETCLDFSDKELIKKFDQLFKSLDLESI